jgi:hypothetical protein
MKKNADAGTGPAPEYKGSQTGTGMLRYRTETSVVGGINLGADAQLCKPNTFPFVGRL